MTPPEIWTWLARVRRPQGRKGEVFADLLTDYPEKFAERRRLWLLGDTAQATKVPREVELISHWPHKGGIVLHFAGVDSITAAETLKGLIVGEIEGVDRMAGPVALLVVRGALGEVLIPFAKSYLRHIDLRAKRVEMALPEGLVDLNAPGKTP
ncbi:MAG: hypothetical protein ABSC76_20615 [Terracidiphilus sp.]